MTPEQATPEICGILRSQIGHDFSGHYQDLHAPRAAPYAWSTQLNTLDAYVERLKREPDEVGALFGETSASPQGSP
jgi:two-component system, chemotaxis family, CheB/CheR fusion protein